MLNEKDYRITKYLKNLLYLEDSFYFLLTLLTVLVQVIPINNGFHPLHFVRSVNKLQLS